MKKSGIILFSFFYLLTAAGFNVNAHWCGKKLNFILIDTPHEKKCSCGKAMQSDCCKDVHVYVKVSDNQKASSGSFLSKSSVKEIVSSNLLTSRNLSAQIDLFDFSNYHAPPFKTKPSVFLKNGILRI